MSKIILDKYPNEPKECPFCEVEYCWGGTNYDREEYFCHLREGTDFDCHYALRECVGCDKCNKIASLDQM